MAIYLQRTEFFFFFPPTWPHVGYWREGKKRTGRNTKLQKLFRETGLDYSLMEEKF